MSGAGRAHGYWFERPVVVIAAAAAKADETVFAAEWAVEVSSEESAGGGQYREERIGCKGWSGGMGWPVGRRRRRREVSVW